MRGRLRLAAIACWSIKHVSIDNLSPGSPNFLQEELIISSKLMSDGQQLGVRLEVEVNLVHQQICSLSLGTRINGIYVIYF